MVPYYQDGLITLFHGDWLDVYKSNALGPNFNPNWSVVTDPPYGKNEQTMRGKRGRGKATASLDFVPVHGDTEKFNPEPWIRFKDVILWGANWYADWLPISSSWLVWDKREGIASDDNADCELAWSNIGGPARLFRHYWKGMIKASEKRETRVHPTQKPVALMQWCISLLKDPILILDPYAGGGSTLIAAKKMGIKAIGIEIEEQYCRTIVHRLGGVVNEPDTKLNMRRFL